MREPRDPLLKVLNFLVVRDKHKSLNVGRPGGHPSSAPRSVSQCRRVAFSNDPSAGSPTETLLRLVLPLNDQV